MCDNLNLHMICSSFTIKIVSSGRVPNYSSGELSNPKLEHSLIPPEISSARLSFYTLEKNRALLPVEQVINGGRWHVETIVIKHPR